jgi:3-oxoadipate enol-lactonase
MKNTVLTLCSVIFLLANIFAQTVDNTSSIKVDTGYINVDRGKLYYEIAGKGDNIVLIHDGMLDREVWDDQFPLLAKNYRVVRYDRRTFGKSSDPTAPFSHIEDLNQVFIQLKIEKAIVFGMSAGGGLAIDFTLKYPEKVTGLVLVGAVVSGYGYSPHMFTRGGHLKSFAELSDASKVIKYFAYDDPYEIYSENIKAKEKFVKILERSMHKESGISAIPPSRPGAKFLSEIKVPTLILVGEFDIPDVHSHAGVIEYGIPNSKREVILKSGHLIPLEQPEAFNASMFRFIKDINFTSILNYQGADAAIQYFKTWRESNPTGNLFDEGQMNVKGYQYMNEGKIKEAIKIFTLNTIAYPNSGNVYDSLGEAYLKDGQKDLAKTNYQKSLELDPRNLNAEKVLKEMDRGK